MSSMRLTLCAGVAVAAALIPVPVAYAAGGGISVTPSSPAPGSDVRLVVRGCTGKTGTAKSKAFVADVLLARQGEGQGQDGALVGGSRVRSTLTPGTYDVTVGCDGQAGKVKGTIAVVKKKAGEKAEESEWPGKPPSTEPYAEPYAVPSAKPYVEPYAKPSAEPYAVPSAKPYAEPSREAASPVAPVPAGGGGAAEELAAAERLAADARDTGPGTRQTVVGLVLAGVAAVAVVVRGVRRRRGTD